MSQELSYSPDARFKAGTAGGIRCAGMNRENCLMVESGFLKIRNGLIDDPKHFKRMGPAIWTYLYLHHKCDWGTGRLKTSIEKIAQERDVSESTIKRDIKKLKDERYINITRQQYGLIIDITKFDSKIKVKSNGGFGNRHGK